MHTSRRFLLLLALGLWPLPALAASVGLAWDAPWDTGPTSWLLHAVHIAKGVTTQSDQALETFLTHEDCKRVDPAYEEGQTWCADLGCPPEGLYTMHLEAGEDLVFFALDTACTLIDYEEALKRARTEYPAMPQPTVDPSPLPPDTPPSAEVPAGDNLIPDPTFAGEWNHEGYAGTKTSTSLDASVLCNGAPTMLLTGEGDYFGHLSSARVAVTAGADYTASVWVKTENITRFVELDVFWFNEQGKQLAWNESVGGRVSGTQDCTQIGGTVTAPPDSAKALLEIRVMSHEGRAWVGSLDLRGPPRAATPPPTDPPPPTEPPPPTDPTSPPPAETPPPPPAAPVAEVPPADLPARPTEPSPLPVPVEEEERPSRDRLRAAMIAVTDAFEAMLAKIEAEYTIALRVAQKLKPPKGASQDAYTTLLRLLKDTYDQRQQEAYQRAQHDYDRLKRRWDKLTETS